jgi:hypothetical protein
VVTGETGSGTSSDTLMRSTFQTERDKKMRKQSIVAHATMIVALVLALSAAALAADPYVGTWKLNVAKSKINIGPVNIKRSTLTITAQDNGIKVVEDYVEADERASHLEFAAKFDGKDYPVTGVSDFDTNVLQRIDSNTWSEVLKKAGKEIFRARCVVSKDGKTLTRTEKEKNAKGEEIINTFVYDKQ